MPTFTYKAILFDCDGVILDTETLSSRILCNLLNEVGLDIDEKTLYDRFAGFTTEHNLRTATAMLGKPLPSDFLTRYNKAFSNAIQNDLTPIDGVTDILNRIQCPIAMATNAIRSETEHKLELVGLKDTFKVRFCVDDVANGKPAPDLYLAAANALGIAPKDCIVIEDSLVGIKAGASAGATVLAYSASTDSHAQRDAGATYTFSHMSELINLLGL